MYSLSFFPLGLVHELVGELATQGPEPPLVERFLAGQPDVHDSIAGRRQVDVGPIHEHIGSAEDHLERIDARVHGHRDYRHELRPRRNPA
jgi:hypothetical protein